MEEDLGKREFNALTCITQKYLLHKEQSKMKSPVERYVHLTFDPIGKQFHVDRTLFSYYKK